MKVCTYNVLSGVALAFLVFVLARAIVSEIRYVHERSSVKTILAALAADVTTEADLGSVFPQSQSPYRLTEDPYTKWMEEKHKNGKLDSANDFKVDMWGVRYAIRAELSKDGSITLSVSSAGQDGHSGTGDDIVEESVVL